MELHIQQAPEVQAVPLSENEQRQLDAIERGLYADDPKFAANVRSSDLRSYNRRRLIRASLLFGLGCVLLIFGLFGGIVLSIVGFAFMFIALMLAATALKRLKHPGDARFGQAGPTARRAAPAPKQGWRERAEERFRRRFDDRG